MNKDEFDFYNDLNTGPEVDNPRAIALVRDVLRGLDLGSINEGEALHRLTIITDYWADSLDDDDLYQGPPQGPYVQNYRYNDDETDYPIDEY